MRKLFYLILFLCLVSFSASAFGVTVDGVTSATTIDGIANIDAIDGVDAGPAYDEYTMLLLHSDVGDETDATGRHSVTKNGSPTISESGKFGGAWYFDGAYRSIEIAQNSDFDMGTHVWTIDFWLNCTNSANTASILKTKGPTTKSVTVQQYSNNIYTYVSSNGSSWDLNSDASFAASTGWQHLAYVYDGENLKIYKDGTLQDTIAAATINNSSDGGIMFGGPDEGYELEGYIDEFRFSNNVRWTGNFTAPTTPY